MGRLPVPEPGSDGPGRIPKAQLKTDRDVWGQNRMHTWQGGGSRAGAARSLRPRLFTSRFYLSASAAERAAVGGNSSGASADVNPREGRTKGRGGDRSGCTGNNKPRQITRAEVAGSGACLCAGPPCGFALKVKMEPVRLRGQAVPTKGKRNQSNPPRVRFSSLIPQVSGDHDPLIRPPLT